ncbi:MAG: SpoIIE family protein phosphatase [Candidatus Anammoximicrobium sp.]|nr:SpoIIE family protein phosphatase [Candidatus Anammoximicrobium sp.]
MPVLRLVKGPGAPREFTLDASDVSRDSFSVLIGRDERVCSIHLSHPCVSRRHARVAADDLGFALADEESKAGTFLNGQRLKPRAACALRHRDRIEICGYTFVYQDEAPECAGCAGDEDTSSPEPEIPDAGSALDGSTTTWLMRTDFHAQPKLAALMQLTKELRKAVTLDDLLPDVLDGLLALHAQADRALIVLRETGSGRPGTIRVRQRGSGRMTEAAQAGKLIREVIATGNAIMSDQALTISAPLSDLEGKPLGAIQLDALASQQVFQREDLELLATVAFQVSFVVENAMLHEAALRERALETELKLAQEIQVELLPSEAPQIDGYEFFDYYAPAKYVGGDYYDYLPLDDDRLALVVGDVSGKGVPAALLMVKVASELEASLATERDPVAALNSVNRRFSRRNPDGAFVTMVLAILDLARHQMSVVNAGHLRPLLRRPDGTVVEIGDAEAGMPLGVVPARTYEQTQLQINAGDALVLISDGITEAQSAGGRQYGQPRLLAQLAASCGTAADLGRRIIDDVDRFVGSHPQSDDRCLLCLRRGS